MLFSQLDLVVQAGEALELTGPNGSGKTTLLRCIAGLSNTFDGDIELEGFLYLGHASGLSGLLSVRENQRWYASLTGAHVTDAELNGALSRVKLAGYQDIPCMQLSAGEKRRVTLSRLIFSDSPLWLLDEPLTALDEGGVALVCELIAEHCAQGGAVVYATHQLLNLSDKRQLDLGQVNL